MWKDLLESIRYAKSSYYKNQENMYRKGLKTVGPLLILLVFGGCIGVWYGVVPSAELLTLEAFVIAVLAIDFPLLVRVALISDEFLVLFGVVTLSVLVKVIATVGSVQSAITYFRRK